MRKEQIMVNRGETEKLDVRKRTMKALKKAVEKLCPLESKVEIQEMRKNNGIVKLGMVIDGKGKMINPIIYLEPYLERIEAGDSSVEEMAKSIIAVYPNPYRGEADMGSIVQDVESVKEKMIFQLVSLERNQEMLSHMPYRRIGEDLAVIYALLWKIDCSGMMTVKVNQEHRKLWGMSEEELWELAKVNTPRLFPVEMKSIEDVMCDLFRKQLEAEGIVLDEKVMDELFNPNKWQTEVKESHNLQMYVLSNQYGAWGASAILYPGVLRKAAKKLGGDLLILPSSIHEVILVRHENMGEYDKIAEFVKEINQKEVLPEDVLSDSVYWYKEKDGSFCRIAGYCGKDAGCM